MAHELPKLSYAYDALEPHIDALTMEIHHSKHHQGYVNKLNAALEKYPDYQNISVEDLLRQLSSSNIDAADQQSIINSGGGHANHTLYWATMAPEKEIDESLVHEIELTFDSLDNFKKLFTKEALGRFGSGWSWLVRDEMNKLKVYSTANQDSPLMKGHTPVFGLDVWEHAYYLKYQNKRAEYIEHWWSVLKLI